MSEEHTQTYEVIVTCTCGLTYVADSPGDALDWGDFHEHQDTDTDE